MKKFEGDLAQKMKTAVPFLITALLIGIVIIQRFVELYAKKDAQIQDIMLGFVFSGAILVTMHIIWRPAGKDSVRNNPESAYSKNAARYGELVSDINNKKLNARFREFCAKKTAEFLRQKQEDTLKDAGVTYEEYLNYTNEHINAEFTKKQKRVISKVYRGKIKVRELNPLSIMTDSVVRRKYSYGVDYNEPAEEAVSISIKIMQKLVTALILGYISYDKLSGGLTSDVLIDFAVNLSIMVTSAWGGYSGGVKQYSLRKNDIFKRRLQLLGTFFEDAKTEP